MKIKTFMLLLLLSTHLFAQEVEIPKNLELATEQEYKETEALVLETIDWLHNQPLSENPSKRKELNAFLMQWMSGTPSFSIVLVSGIVPMECAACLMSFMAGWTKYSLNNNYSGNNVNCAMAGAEQAIEFYENNKSEIGKNSDMEKLIKRKKKGKLKKTIESLY